MLLEPTYYVVHNVVCCRARRAAAAPMMAPLDALDGSRRRRDEEAERRNAGTPTISIRNSYPLRLKIYATYRPRPHNDAQRDFLLDLLAGARRLPVTKQISLPLPRSELSREIGGASSSTPSGSDPTSSLNDSNPGRRTSSSEPLPRPCGKGPHVYVPGSTAPSFCASFVNSNRDLSSKCLASAEPSEGSSSILSSRCWMLTASCNGSMWKMHSQEWI